MKLREKLGKTHFDYLTCAPTGIARRAHENKRELHKMLLNWVENEHGNIFLLEFCHKIEPQ